MSATRIRTQDIFDAAVTDPKLSDSGVVANVYKAASLTVNAKGRITSAANILTTKGDLLVYGSDVGRKAVGTNGQFLVADSAQSDGLVWHTLTNSDVTTALGYTPVNKAGDTMLGFLTLNADPVNPLHAATKQYVDSVAAGLDVKQSVRLATIAPLPANTPSGLVLTADANGALSIDGIAVADGDRVLIKDEVNAENNGIYDVTDSGDGSTPFILTRSYDADNSPTGGEVTSGMFTFVEEGNSNADTGWVLATDNPIVLGTTELEFSQFSNAGSFVSGAGLYRSGNIVNVGTASTSRIVVNTDDIDLAMTGVGGGTYTKLTVDVWGRVTAATQATTSDIAEGSNLYFTNERVDDRVAALIQNGTGLTWTYDDNLNTLTGNVSLAPFDTDDLAEGSTNLYYTDARVTTLINASFVDNEEPTGTIDGVNDEFTLAFTPVDSSEHVYKNGVRQKPGALNDYTISGATITFNAGNIPQTGDSLIVDYRK